MTLGRTRSEYFEKTICVVLVIGLALHTAGCSLFVGSMQPVTITASDPRAEIFVDGQQVGTGSVTLQLKRNKSHGVMARVGQRSGSAHIGKTISTTGVLDLVGGFLLLVPFLGVLGPGFWSLDPDNVQISVPPGPEREDASSDRVGGA